MFLSGPTYETYSYCHTLMNNTGDSFCSPQFADFWIQAAGAISEITRLYFYIYI